MNWTYKFHGGTDIGRVRSQNEDHFYVPSQDTDLPLVIVADGMGGYKGGDIASKMCVNIVHQYISSKIQSDYTVEDIKELIYEAVNIASGSILDYANENEFYSGMGTTIVMAYIYGRHCIIANVGDSRAYVISRHSFYQITKDHSLVQHYVDQGKLTLEEAATHPQRNIVTRALGSEHDVLVDVFDHVLEDHETLLLCSDGLYEHVDEHILQRIATNRKGLKRKTEEYIHEANHHGGTDNITVALARVKGGQ